MPSEVSKVDWSNLVMWPGIKWYCTAVQYNFWKGECCQLHLTIFKLLKVTCHFALFKFM